MRHPICCSHLTFCCSICTLNVVVPPSQPRLAAFRFVTVLPTFQSLRSSASTSHLRDQPAAPSDCEDTCQSSPRNCQGCRDRRRRAATPLDPAAKPQAKEMGCTHYRYQGFDVVISSQYLKYLENVSPQFLLGKLVSEVLDQLNSGNYYHKHAISRNYLHFVGIGCTCFEHHLTTPD
jgi:hypothetical protein